MNEEKDKYLEELKCILKKKEVIFYGDDAALLIDDEIQKKICHLYSNYLKETEDEELIKPMEYLEDFKTSERESKFYFFKRNMKMYLHINPKKKNVYFLKRPEIKRYYSLDDCYIQFNFLSKLMLKLISEIEEKPLNYSEDAKVCDCFNQKGGTPYCNSWTSMMDMILRIINELFYYKDWTYEDFHYQLKKKKGDDRMNYLIELIKKIPAFDTIKPCSRRHLPFPDITLMVKNRLWRLIERNNLEWNIENYYEVLKKGLCQRRINTSEYFEPNLPRFIYRLIELGYSEYTNILASASYFRKNEDKIKKMICKAILMMRKKKKKDFEELKITIQMEHQYNISKSKMRKRDRIEAHEYLIKSSRKF